MTFIEETSNTRIATTALWLQALRPIRRGIFGTAEPDVPLTGNSGARPGHPCFDLIGLGRVCLHFNAGWQPMDLPEGSFVHTMRKTYADRKLKTVIGNNRGDEREGNG